jgi:hypothetical protein
MTFCPYGCYVFYVIYAVKKITSIRFGEIFFSRLTPIKPKFGNETNYCFLPIFCPYRTIWMIFKDGKGE